MDKVFSVAAVWPDALDGGGELFVDLPATPCELRDVREKLRLGAGEAALFRVDEFYRFDFLAPHLSETYDLVKLNALAEKLSELEPEQVTVLAGLVQMDEVKQASPIGLPRLIDLAYSTERCHIVGEVLNDAQLGRFCAENGFLPELDGLPDEVFDLLDFERIGREHRQREGGVLVDRTADHPGGYVERHSDLVQAYKEINEQPEQGRMEMRV